MDHRDPNRAGCRILSMQAVDQRNFAEGASSFGAGNLETGLPQTMGMPTGAYEITCSADMARLIEAVAAERDREAFTALFDYFAPRIKAFLMRSNTPAAAAEELAQDAMLTVWRKAAQFDRTRAGASAWIFTIARNLRIDVARREQRGKVLDLESSEFLEPPAAAGRGIRCRRARTARARRAFPFDGRPDAGRAAVVFRGQSAWRHCPRT